jgi:hypothetical protein
MLLVWLALGVGAASAQIGFTAVTQDRLILRAGPSETYDQVGLINGGVDVVILERNRSGTWLHITNPEGDDTEPDSAWVLTGMLNLDEDTQLGQVRVSDLPDAEPDNVLIEQMAWLYAAPVLPQTISDAMRDVYAAGQAMGNDSQTVTKVGDSNSVSRLYLSPISSGQYDLGPYAYLQTTVDTFGESFDAPSIAARIGLNVFSVFDPIWADPDQCEADETPLACEYRTKQPAFAIIMFGQNDARVLNTEQYEQQTRRLIETSIEYGVVPLLVTFTSDQDADETVFYQALRFNRITVEVAAEYGVPVLNFWAAARPLPRYGIGEDNVHLTSSGEAVDFSGGYQSRFGLTLHNLLVLQSLDILRQALALDADGLGDTLGD